jgi:hypothetical protein
MLTVNSFPWTFQGDTCRRALWRLELNQVDTLEKHGGRGGLDEQGRVSLAGPLGGGWLWKQLKGPTAGALNVLATETGA